MVGVVIYLVCYLVCYLYLLPKAAAHRFPDALPFCYRAALSLFRKNFDSVAEMLRDVLIQSLDARAFFFRG